MPIVTIEMRPRDYAKKAEIARIFTDELSRIIDVPKESITILFHELSSEQIAIAGEMLAEKSKTERFKHP